MKLAIKRTKKYICNICNLDYPADEMRGKICYLCKDEMAKRKIIDKIKIKV